MKQRVDQREETGTNSTTQVIYDAETTPERRDRNSVADPNASFMR